MKKILIPGLLTLASFFTTVAVAQQKTGCSLGDALNKNYSKAAALDSVMRRYAPGILPGTAMAVFTEAEGWWAGAQGYASTEQKIPMQNCHLQYLQSVSKMYLAVEILLLKEQGRMVLDSPMTKYLPARHHRYVKNASAITVRMLLNHTSGVAEYNVHPLFVSQVMQHPDKYFDQEFCLQTILAENSQFTPGSKYQYTNTNYVLLSLIGDALTGNHAAFINQYIFKPLALNNTYYGNGHHYLKGLDLPQSYWDIANVERPANFTVLQRASVASSKGDDGIVCTPVDAVKFLKGLMEGRLLKPETLREMMTFVKDEKNNNRYGLGITYFDLGGLPAYGHGGGGIGAGCGLIYIPSHKTYLFISTNLGVMIDGKLPAKADAMKTEILMTLLQ
jgi:D-alanyl-D-alanine carboxypeptidase